MEAPRSQAGGVERCPLCGSPNRVPSPEDSNDALSSGGEINIARQEPVPGMNNQSAGFLYVLVNSAMQGLIKVGKTQRNPETRAQELSGVTGIPTPFVVAYHEWFRDCSAAEDFVHTFLETKGYRVADNREFFSAPVKIAIQAIMQAKAQQDKLYGSPDEASQGGEFDAGIGRDIGDSEPWADLLQQAEAAHYGLGDAIEDREQAVRLYQQAARLGSGQACLALGQMYASEERGEDYQAAIHWFCKGSVGIGHRAWFG